MAKIFLILTIILTGAAAYFGYTTYQGLDGAKQKLTKAQADVKDMTAKLQKAGDDLKVAKADAATANEKATKAAADADLSKQAADKATADLADLNTKFTAQAADLKKAQDDLAAALANTGKPGTTPTPAGETEKKLADAQAQLQEAKTLSDTLQSKVKDDEDKIAILTKKAEGMAIQKAKPGLEGEIMAVNQGWNFVVVSIGDRQGATANSQLIIKRGDTMIGKVRITSVEPSTSIADIIPDTVPKGQRVMPGDRVIFPVQATP